MFKGIALVSAVATMALLAGCQPAATNAAGGAVQPASLFGGSGMTTFTDPTEDAFTVQAPQGWTAKGGIQRASAIDAKSWLTVSSPDGATTISLGDPSIPLFTLPSAAHPDGSTIQTPSGVGPVKAYETGTDFAADYAQKVFGATCGQLQPGATQSEPDLVQHAQARATQMAQNVGVPPPQTQFDGGSEKFTCAADGSTVDVMAVTALNQGQFGGFWSVANLIAYHTPAAQAAQTDQTARAMQQSYQINAAWDANMVAASRQQLAAIQQQGQQQMAALTAQERQESGMLNAQMQNNNARLNAAHAATMAQLNAQGAARNQAFAQHMYDKDTGQQSEMRYINNQTCIRWYDAAHTRCAATASN